MRILMASHGYPPTISGVTLVVQKLARAMVQKGHAVTVVTASDRQEPYEATDQGVRLVRVHSWKNPYWKEGPIPTATRAELDALVDEFQPDVLHVHEVAVLALRFRGLARRYGLPLLASCHFVPRFAGWYLGENGLRHPVESVVRNYSVWFLNRCDHVVFATQAHLDFFRKLGMTAPTTIVSNGVDTVRYCAQNGSDPDVENKYHLPPGPRIMFVSRLMRDKEIDVLIRAMPRVASLGAHLLLVGRGDDRPRLEAIVQEMGLEQQVHFLGFVPEEDMPALYRAVDLFAMVSTCEVQSLPTLQAMCTALPVVAADAMALPEIVKHQVNGLLVPPGDVEAVGTAMYRILSDREMARRMGQEGRRIVEQHRERYTFDGYEAVYQRLVERQAHRLPVAMGR
jgi:1,2-diacylglycerol 3-alpha-glucosyltransferase